MGFFEFVNVEIKADFTVVDNTETQPEDDQILIAEHTTDSINEEAIEDLVTETLEAALPAAIAFTAVNYLYLETQVLVTRLNAVYGVFAAVPLFMAWINIGWNIILIGSELSYAFQHVDNYNIDD
jgi:pyrrolidone-carboxylate peptidase